MRYFIETSYKGTAYSGFQVQQNANTIQAEIEKALIVFFKQKFTLTGSSRTDAGVHALQNYFHFDTDDPLPGLQGSLETGADQKQFEESVYHLNAILPRDIIITRIFRVADQLHCRFDAVSREYHYFIYQVKNPFLEDRAYYYPYKLAIQKLNNAARLLLDYNDFSSFSKKNTQVKNFNCEIMKSEWILENGTLIYTVKANRFLRGMVKGLVGTMLRVGTQKISIEDFKNIIKNRNSVAADFSVPSRGLFLVKVEYKGVDFNEQFSDL